MRIGRIVALGAGGALAVVGVRKLQQARADRRDQGSSSRPGPVEPHRPLDPEPSRRVDEDQDESVLRPVPGSA